MEEDNKSPVERLAQALQDSMNRKKSAAASATLRAREIKKYTVLREQLDELPQSERRKVLDAAGLKHISAAPPPLPLTLRPPPTVKIRPEDAQPQTPPAPPAINWDDWQAIPGLRLPSVKLWEACAMSLNILPSTLKFTNSGYMAGDGDCGPFFEANTFPSTDNEKTFRLRLSRLLENLSNRELFTPGLFDARNSYLHSVRLEEFSMFAGRCKWAIPEQMLKLAQLPLPTTKSEPQAALKADGVDTDQIDWRNRVRAEAYEQWIKTLAENGTPNLENVATHLAKWCVKHNVNGNLGSPPQASYLKTHVIDGKHWAPPRSTSREAAKKHLQQKKQEKHSD